MLCSKVLNTRPDSTRYSGAGNSSDRTTFVGHKASHVLCHLEDPELRGNNSGSQDLQRNFGTHCSVRAKEATDAIRPTQQWVSCNELKHFPTRRDGSFTPTPFLHKFTSVFHLVVWYVHLQQTAKSLSQGSYSGIGSTDISTGD